MCGNAHNASLTGHAAYWLPRRIGKRSSGHAVSRHLRGGGCGMGSHDGLAALVAVPLADHSPRCRGSHRQTAGEPFADRCCPGRCLERILLDLPALRPGPVDRAGRNRSHRFLPANLRDGRPSAGGRRQPARGEDSCPPIIDASRSRPCHERSREASGCPAGTTAIATFPRSPLSRLSRRAWARGISASV